MMKFSLALSAAAVVLSQDAPTVEQPTTVIRRAPVSGLYGRGFYGGRNGAYPAYRPAAVGQAVAAPLWNANRAVYAPAAVNPFAQAAAPGGLNLFGSAPVNPPAGLAGEHLDHWYDMQIADAVVDEQMGAFLNVAVYETSDVWDESGENDRYYDRLDIVAKLEKDGAHRAAVLAHQQDPNDGTALDLKEAELEKAIADLHFSNINKKLTKKEADRVDDLDWMVDDIDRQAALLDLAEAQTGGDAAEIAEAQRRADSWSLISYSNLIDLRQEKPNRNQRDIIDKGDKLEDMIDMIDDTENFEKKTAALPEAEYAVRANPSSRVHQLEYEIARNELTLATIDFISSMGNFFGDFEISSKDQDMHDIIEAVADLEVAKLERELISLGAPGNFHMNRDGNMVVGGN